MKPYYTDDHATLYHGDCLETTDWLAAHVLITDPPYGVGYKAHNQRHNPIRNDHDFTCTQSAVESWGARPMAVFANHASLSRTLTAVSALLAPRVRVAVWHKINRTMGVANPWLADIEFVVMGVREYPTQTVSAVITTRTYTGNPASNADPDAYLHPTQKRVQGMYRVIEAMPPGVIADPFAGSGSTLVAAKALGRKSIGVELEERYCEITANRLSQGVFDFMP